MIFLDVLVRRFLHGEPLRRGDNARLAREYGISGCVAEDPARPSVNQDGRVADGPCAGHRNAPAGTAASPCALGAASARWGVAASIGRGRGTPARRQAAQGPNDARHFPQAVNSASLRATAPVSNSTASADSSSNSSSARRGSRITRSIMPDMSHLRLVALAGPVQPVLWDAPFVYPADPMSSFPRSDRVVP